MVELTFSRSVPGGIDIRDNADTSLGARKPILGRSGRTETLPLASIALSMCERPEASTFFEHWEEVTRLSSMDVMQSGFVGSRSGSSATRAARGGRLPKSFFDKSPSKRGFPFNKSVNLVNTTGKPYLVYTELLRQKFTPVNHGDLLWLIDRFLMEHFPKGGALDPVPGSVHADSMFLLVTDFCAQPKYMHHPHLRTFLAMASMSEMGLDERNIPINAFRMAVSVIRGTFTESASRAVLKINNERLEFKRQIMTIKSKRMRIFHDVDEDDLDYSVELIADEAFSAEVGDSAEEGDNDDEMLFDLSSSGKGKGKGQMVEDDDAYDANDSSEILF
ncbi:hypothetical protein N0V86_001966 [Didymella sp. IMI 355093]|nr:hypothetical protein N0V86_001966 [Didymella sp. IMI 355093]